MFRRKKTVSDGEIALELVVKTPGNKEKNWVASNIYDIRRLEDKKVVGRCDIRFGMNPDLYYMGNIGYAIYPPYRGQHYAAKATKLLFEIARQNKMKEIIITCNPDNFASRRTCELAGCLLKEIVDVPAGHELIEQEEYSKCIYVKTL
jgi:predicted acetyltransferase